MRTFKLFSFFGEEDYDKLPLNRSNPFKYFIKPELKRWVADETVQTLINHFVSKGEFTEDDIVCIKYNTIYDMTLNEMILKGIVFVKNK